MGTVVAFFALASMACVRVVASLTRGQQCATNLMMMMMMITLMMTSDVSDDNDGDNVADDDAGAKAMLDDADCAAAPKMNTSLVAVSGMVGAAVGGAKKNAERNCASG